MYGYANSFNITAICAYFAIAASSPSACVGSNITLTANASGGTAAYAYAWTAGPQLQRM